MLSGLKETHQKDDIKRIAGVKHVISTEVDLDNVKGVCKGTGRIQIRLNEGEEPEAIRQRYVNQGIVVQAFKNNPQKTSSFTSPIF